LTAGDRRADALVGALQLWRRAREDPGDTLRDFRAALALGGSRPLPELYRTAGVRFDFSAATLEPLVEAILEELDARETP